MPTKHLQGAELFAAARLALGKQMYSAGIDDGKTYWAIKRLNQLLSARGRDPARQTKLRAERERLFLQLADEALQYDAPLPGAEREYRHVRLLATTHAAQPDREDRSLATEEVRSLGTELGIPPPREESATRHENRRLMMNAPPRITKTTAV